MSLTTLRKILTAFTFDFNSGVFVVPTDSKYCVNYHDYYADKDIELTTKSADEIAEVLDTEFNSGYGGARAPLVLAYDKLYVYVHQDYDGADYYVKVPRNPETLVLVPKNVVTVDFPY